MLACISRFALSAVIIFAVATVYAVADDADDALAPELRCLTTATSGSITIDVVGQPRLLVRFDDDDDGGSWFEHAVFEAIDGRPSLTPTLARAAVLDFAAVVSDRHDTCDIDDEEVIVSWRCDGQFHTRFISGARFGDDGDDDHDDSHCAAPPPMPRAGEPLPPTAVHLAALIERFTSGFEHRPDGICFDDDDVVPDLH